MSVRILIGDVRARLAELPDDTFDCVVTSPPYWGLRDYGTATWEGGDPSCDHRSPTMREGRDEQRATLAGSAATNSAQLLLAHRSACGKCGAMKVDQQIGLEPTLAEHLAVMVVVMREVRRVLKPTGTCWINYGDCYATSPNGRSAIDTKAAGNDDRTFRDKPFSTIGGFLKAKDLAMIPQRLAIAMQEDGWWIRSLLPWVKRNGMPESINDRPANSVEYVIFATKSARYAYNADAVRRVASPATNARVSQDVASQVGSTRANGGRKTNGTMKAVVRRFKTADAGLGIKNNGSFDAALTQVVPDRNFRNTDLFFDSLTPPFGLICDADGTPLAIDINPQGFSEAHFATFPPGLVEPLLRAGCPANGLVLDPFGGAGTVGLVADRMGLDCTLIELNPEYAEISRARIAKDAGMFSSVEVAA